jgi:predicted nucleotidyltransferase
MEQEQIIVEFLKERIPGIKGIYLFGSHADGTARPDSDYDVAYLTERPEKMESLTRFNLAVELGGQLGSSVDLVDLQNASIDFRFVIVSTAKRIYCGDVTFCDTFDMITFSMYQRFEEERRPIIEDIKKRGRIYG